jgi:hypothetical protein
MGERQQGRPLPGVEAAPAGATPAALVAQHVGQLDQVRFDGGIAAG